MRNYYIEINWFKPYPRQATFTEKAGTPSVAISRAMRKWRAQNPRIKVKKFRIEITQI